MKCQEVNKLLVAYLDNEVTPSEHTLIRAHLARCDTCQRELAALSALQSRVSQFLKVRAAQATPSPHAWSRLQARLAREARPLGFQRLALAIQRVGQAFPLREGTALKQRLVLALIVTLVITTGIMVFVPSIKAQVGEAIVQWLRVEVPDGRFKITMLSPDVDFIPLYPTYLPPRLIYSLEDGGKGIEAFRQVYAGKDWFIEIVQTKSPAERSLPTGREVNINGQPGVLNTGLQGKFELVPRFEARESVYPSVYTYVDGKRLTWYVGDIKVEMLSNLSEEEVLKIAQSMMPLKGGTR